MRSEVNASSAFALSSKVASGNTDKELKALRHDLEAERRRRKDVEQEVQGIERAYEDLKTEKDSLIQLLGELEQSPGTFREEPVSREALVTTSEELTELAQLRDLVASADAKLEPYEKIIPDFSSYTLIKKLETINILFNENADQCLALHVDKEAVESNSDRLVANIENLNLDNHRLEAELAAFAIFKNERDELLERVEKLQVDLDATATRSRGLELSNQASESKHVELSVKVSELDALKVEHQQLQTTFKAKDDELTLSKATIAELEVSRLRTLDLENEVEVLTGRTVEVEGLRSRVTQLIVLESLIIGKSQKIEDLEASVIEISKTVATKNEELATFKAQAEEIAAAMIIKGEELNLLKDQVEETAIVTASKDEELTTLKADLEEKATYISDLKSELETFATVDRGLEVVKNDLETETSELRTKADDLEIKTAELKSALEAKEAEIESLKIKVDLHVNSNLKLITSKEAEINDLLVLHESKALDLTSENASLTFMLSKHMKELEDLRSQIDSKSLEHESFNTNRSCEFGKQMEEQKNQEIKWKAFTISKEAEIQGLMQRIDELEVMIFKSQKLMELRNTELSHSHVQIQLLNHSVGLLEDSPADHNECLNRMSLRDGELKALQLSLQKSALRDTESIRLMESKDFQLFFSRTQIQLMNNSVSALEDMLILWSDYDALKNELDLWKQHDQIQKKVVVEVIEREMQVDKDALLSVVSTERPLELAGLLTIPKPEVKSMADASTQDWPVELVDSFTDSLFIERIDADTQKSQNQTDATTQESTIYNATIGHYRTQVELLNAKVDELVDQPEDWHVRYTELMDKYESVQNSSERAVVLAPTLKTLVDSACDPIELVDSNSIVASKTVVNDGRLDEVASLATVPALAQNTHTSSVVEREIYVERTTLKSVNRSIATPTPTPTLIVKELDDKFAETELSGAAIDAMMLDVHSYRSFAVAPIISPLLPSLTLLEDAKSCVDASCDPMSMPVFFKPLADSSCDPIIWPASSVYVQTDVKERALEFEYAPISWPTISVATETDAEGEVSAFGKTASSTSISTSHEVYSQDHTINTIVRNIVIGKRPPNVSDHMDQILETELSGIDITEMMEELHGLRDDMIVYRTDISAKQGRIAELADELAVSQARTEDKESKVTRIAELEEQLSLVRVEVTNYESSLNQQRELVEETTRKSMDICDEAASTHGESQELQKQLEEEIDRADTKAA